MAAAEDYRHLPLLGVVEAEVAGCGDRGRKGNVDRLRAFEQVRRFGGLPNPAVQMRIAIVTNGRIDRSRLSRQRGFVDVTIVRVDGAAVIPRSRPTHRAGTHRTVVLE